MKLAVRIREEAEGDQRREFLDIALSLLKVLPKRPLQYPVIHKNLRCAYLGRFPFCILLLTSFLGLAGCDFGKKDRETAEAIYKANAEAAKACKETLKGLKLVPIWGTDRKLFIDAERLPSWSISNDFRPGDECGASELFNGEIFYWTGEEIIPKSVWLANGHSLVERPGPTDWYSVLADLVGFSKFKSCKENPTACEESEKNRNTQYPGRTVPLKNYPIDVFIPDGWETNPKLGVGYSLRDWPKENGNRRRISCPENEVVSKKMSDEEISLMVFNEKKPMVCQIESSEFEFRSGGARIILDSKDFSRITPVLIKIEEYLNNSIKEGK